MYPWSQDELFDETRHVLISQRPAEAANGDTILLPNVWRDKTTGQVFRQDDFRGKRLFKAAWDTIKLAILAIAGTCFHLAYQRPDDCERPQIIGFAVMIWLALTILTLVPVL